MYHINESAYDDRVAKHASVISRGKSLTKKDIDRDIEHSLDDSGNAPVERKVGGKAWSDFRKDVHAHLKSKGLIARDKAPERAPYSIEAHGDYYKKIPVSHDDISHLADKISDSIGNSYPDGDPHDAIESHMRRKGWDSSHAFEKLVPIALKKHLGVKHGDLHKHIHDVWKDADDSTGYSSAHHWE